jgi:HEAT repeat protein
MRNVFISYCHEDADFAQLLEAEVRNRGFHTWRDLSLNAGDDWRIEIDSGIREALAVILIITNASLASAYVNYEWAFALGCEVPVVPVLLKPVEELPSPLVDLGPLHFTDRASRPWNLLIDRLSELRDALRPSTVHVPRGTPPAIQRAAQTLDSMDEDERHSALASLSQTTHPSVVEILAEAVRHPVKQVRFGAAAALVEHHDPRAIPALLEGLSDRHREGVRYTYVEPWMLGKIGKPAVPALLAVLHETNGAQEPVYVALGVIGGPEAVSGLLGKLHDADPAVRSGAAYGLALAKDPSAIPALRGLVRDPDDTVRYRALWALKECSQKAGELDHLVPLLIESLDDEALYSVAAAGLKSTKDARAVPHLLRLALTAESDSVRTAARDALQDFGPAPVAGLREAAVHPDPEVRERAIKLLVQFKDPADLPLLIRAVRDPNRTLRGTAICALRGEYARPAVPALVEALQDDDGDIVRWAVITLGGIGDPAAVNALIERLEDDDDIAKAAANALDDIGTREARAAAKAWNKRKAKHV